jgi:hypothetical protein
MDKNVGKMLLPVSKSPQNPTSKKNSAPSWLALLLLAAISAATYPKHFTNIEIVTQQSVFYFGWITALATGLGVLPFAFISSPSSTMLALANAMAAGMMGSASAGLIFQGTLSTSSRVESILRTAFGACFGWLFIVVAKKILEKYEDVVSIESIAAADARKIILVIFVMTLHSFSEGVGIGVSFSGDSALGVFISMSLAAHNIPEGLAVALVVRTRGFSLLDTVIFDFIRFSLFHRFMIPLSTCSSCGLFSPAFLSRLWQFQHSCLWKDFSRFFHWGNTYGRNEVISLLIYSIG